MSQKECTNNWDETIYTNTVVTDYMEDIYYKYRKTILSLLKEMPIYTLNYRITQKEATFDLIPMPKNESILSNISELKKVIKIFHSAFIEVHKITKKKLSPKAVFNGYFQKEKHRYTVREGCWYLGKDYPSSKKSQKNDLKS